MKHNFSPLYNMLALLLLLTTTCIQPVRAHYQPADTTDASIYIYGMEAFLGNAVNLKFQAYKYTERTTDSVTVRDTLLGYYYYNNGNSHVYENGRVQIQNNVYNILVESGVAITLLKRTNIRESVLKVDLLSPLMGNYYVKRMYATDSSGYKKVKVEFNDYSPWVEYEMLFNASDLVPVSIKYKTPVSDGSATPHYEWVKLNFSNIHYDATDMDTYFRTDYYFSQVNGTFQLTPAFSGYELINLSAY